MRTSTSIVIRVTMRSSGRNHDTNKKQQGHGRDHPTRMGTVMGISQHLASRVWHVFRSEPPEALLLAAGHVRKR